jgi:uncharacterized protein (TIGR02246 family)
MMGRGLILRRSMIAMLLMLAVADVSTAFPGGTVKKMSDDERAIIELHHVFAAAWSKGDTTAAAATYAEDGVRVGAFGDIQRGRAQIKAAYDKLLGGPFKGASVSLGAQSVRMLSSEHAIWQAPMEIHPAGEAAPVKGYAIDVMRKVAGHWLTLEAHPKLFPPQAPKP